jgi:glycerol-3-phosphate responsive antiterminator
LEIGDELDVSVVQFGHGASANGLAANSLTINSGSPLAHSVTTVHNATNDIGLPSNYFVSAGLKAYVRINHDADFPLQTSQDTNNYFPVGSTIEVLDTTWEDDTANDVKSDVSVNVNVYRSFKILSHVKNTHGHMFAKLDSVPTTDSTENYALKVTAHNATVTNRINVEMNANQQEVQVIQPIENDLFAIDDTDTYRIYINKDKANAEFTEVLTGASSNTEIAEAINSFSALSGPVSVDKTKKEIRITFAAIDGDVPELEVVEEVDSGDDTDFYVHTIAEGWSFFAGHSARLENLQPGSVINVTSQEKVSFTITGWTTADHKIAVAYDGHMGTSFLTQGTIDAEEVVSALNSINNEKGLQKFTISSGDVTSNSTTNIVINMPEGVDASKLELLPVTSSLTVEKTVAKNNNGRSFKVLRVENKEWDIKTVNITSTSDADKLKYLVHNTAPLSVGDEVQVKRSAAATSCDAIPNLDVDYRYITAEAHTVGGSDNTEYSLNSELTQSSGDHQFGACSVKVYRTTLVVDSMPDTMAATGFGENVNLHVYGPKGSCSVSEVVKGTYESDVCSSRGNCDGASGLCVCHEGYSGEACETQTVLV